MIVTSDLDWRAFFRPLPLEAVQMEAGASSTAPFGVVVAPGDTRVLSAAEVVAAGLGGPD